MRRFYTSENGFIEKVNWEPECWINIECPDKEDFRYLSEELCVPRSFLDSASDEDERPRFDHEDGWLLTILRIPTRIDVHPAYYGTLTFAVITKDDLLITISKHHTEMLGSFIEHTQRKHIVDIKKPDFLLHLIDSATFWYLKYLKEINDRVSSSFSDFNRRLSNNTLYEMLQMQKSLVYFNTSLRGNSTLVVRIDKMFVDSCDPDLLDDVQIEIAQAQNTANVYMEILASVMDTLDSVISNNVNEIMKKMTSVSIILMLPTLIASFYGMNVAVAFGASPHAFWGIVAASLGLAVVIYIILRRARWI